MYQKTAVVAVILIVNLIFSSTDASIVLAEGDIQQESSFAPSECEFELPANLVEGRDINCGYLTVPETYADPQGKQIKLAVAIIRSTNSTPPADPLFMQQGGPGGSTIDAFLKQFSIDSRLRADREIVLLEQRGTLNSAPSLMCPELDQMTLDTLEKDLTQDEVAMLSLEAAQKCHDRLEKSGINLSDYDSLENARDIENLRLALGYEKINLYGVSYGSLLALHYMNLFPQSLRSVILDGVLPPQINFQLKTTSTIDQSLKTLFSTCQADPDCRENYPNLEATLYSLVDQFNQSPVTIPLTDPDSKITYQTVIDGDSFLNSIAQMLYATSIIPALPRVIYDAQKGEFGFFSRILTLILFDRTLAYGMYYSVLCAEDSDFTIAEQDLEGVHPVVASVLQRSPQDFLQTCKMWEVENLDANIDLPVTSDVPTLLLSGKFDPVTPEEYAQAAAETLENSTLVTFPNGGHGQAFEGECQDQVILDFLNNPGAELDTSCVGQIEGVDFYTSENVIDAPFVFGLMNLERSAAVQFLIILINSIFLFTAVLFIPLAGIIRWLNPPEEVDSLPGDMESSKVVSTPIPARFIGWLSFTVGFLAPLFILLLIVAIGFMVAENDNRLLYGLTGEARLTLYLPPLIFLLSLFWLVALFQRWRLKIGSTLSRIYHTFLIANVATYLTILAIWGLLFNFL